MTFALTISASADYPDSLVIKDQLHILNSAQRQDVISINQHWDHKRNRPQIWVYTYRNLPKRIHEGLVDASPSSFDFKDRYANPATDITSQSIQPKFSPTQANWLDNHVSYILVFPYRHQYHTIFIASGQTDIAISDFQYWWLRHNSPLNSSSAAGVMMDFRNYGWIVSHQVAGIKQVKPGLSWNAISIIVLVPILLWAFHKFFRHPIKDMLESDPRYDNWSSAMWFWHKF